mgnify:CR=1 FL=1
MIARLAANTNSSLSALQSYEENLGINYDKLSYRQQYDYEA